MVCLRAIPYPPSIRKIISQGQLDLKSPSHNPGHILQVLEKSFPKDDGIEIELQENCESKQKLKILSKETGLRC